jgi:spore coat polysaccharide biosynthesis protein SpsF (cytidylyltransferase family)
VSVGLIIFSRYDSSRLPGKALLKVAGKCLLGRVIERSRLVSHKVDLVVATSSRVVDDPIAKFANDQGVTVFRGDAFDVRRRALDCCAEFGFSYFGRVCGDSPILLPSIWDEAFDLAESGRYDLVTNTFPRSFPVGMSVEVFRVSALAKSKNVDSGEIAREHLGSSFYALPDEFSIQNILFSKRDASGIQAAVDTSSDLLKIDQFFKDYELNLKNMSISQIVDALDPRIEQK